MAQMHRGNTSRIKELGKTQRRLALRPPRPWRDRFMWIGGVLASLTAMAALSLLLPIHAGKPARQPSHAALPARQPASEQADKPAPAVPSLPPDAADKTPVPPVAPRHPEVVPPATPQPPVVERRQPAVVSAPPVVPSANTQSIPRREEVRHLPFGLDPLSALPALEAAWLCVEPASLPAEAKALGAYRQMHDLMQQGTSCYQATDFAGAAAFWQRGWETAWSRNYKDCMLAFACNLGDACLRSAMFARAAETYEQADRLLQLQASPTVDARLSAKRAIAYAEIGKHDIALSLYEQARQVFASLSEKGREALVTQGMSAVFARRWAITPAAELAQRALVLWRAANSTADVVGILTQLAVIRRLAGDYSQALQCLDEALSLQRKLYDRQREAHLLLLLAGVHAMQKDRAKAVQYCQEALRICRPAANHRGEAEALMQMSDIGYQAGELTAATKLLEQARAVYKSVSDQRGLTAVRGNLGVVYRELGDYRRASLAFREAMDSYRQLQDHAGIGTAAFQMAVTCDEVGDHNNALMHYQGALLGYLKTLDVRGIGDCFIKFTLACRNAGKVAEGMVLAENARQVFDRLGIASEQLDFVMAELHMERGEGDKAWAIYSARKDALHTGYYHLRQNEPVLAKQCFAGDLDSVPSRRLVALIGSALACERERQFEQAADFYRQAYIALEQKRSSLYDSEKVHFLAGREMFFPRLAPHEGLARVLSRTAEKNRGALYYAETTRGRLFLETTARRYAQESRANRNTKSALPQEWIAQEQEWRNKIAALYHGLEESRDKDERNYAALQQELAQTTASQQEWIARLRRQYPQYAAARYPQPVYVEDIPLATDEFLLEYEVTDPCTRLFVVHGGKVVATRDIAITRRELDELIDRYLGFFHQIKYVSDLARYDVKDARQLYDLLLKPVLEQKDDRGNLRIPRQSRIIVVPDETLGLVPFESLVISAPGTVVMVEGKEGATPLGVRYVGEVYDIAYAASATALSWQRTFRKPGAPAKSLFVLADPIFSNRDERTRMLRPQSQAAEYVDAINRVKALVGQSPPADASSDASDDATGDRDPAEEEVRRAFKTRLLAQNLRQKVFAGEPVDSLLDEQASEQQVKRQDLSQYRYLVFATHGMAETDLPDMFEPALVLSQLDKDEENDGFLSLSEVSSMSFQADVVVLTACRSGLGRNVRGEGVLGLGRAFQHAGARAVLATMWKVSEEAATLFTEYFFTHLKQGKSKRDALRLARRQVRRVGFDHPHYWAPFIMIGD